MQDVARDLHSLTLFCEHIVQTIFETDLVLVGATPLKQKRPVNQKHVKVPMLNLLLPEYFDHERPSKSSRLEFESWWTRRPVAVGKGPTANDKH